MTRLFAAGYPYEIAGLVYYAFFLLMSRGRNAERFSQRTKIATLVAAIALVASVPFHYASRPLGVVVMLALAVFALWCTYRDRARAPVSPGSRSPGGFRRGR